MMVTGQMLVDEARTWIGTPFHHQGRVKTAGVDCAGLIVGVGKSLGLNIPDITGYSRSPDGVTLENICIEGGVEIPIDQAQIGDVFLMRIKREPQHVGFISAISPHYIIHAYSGAHKVVEHRLDDMWGKRIIAMFRIKGVQ